MGRLFIFFLCFIEIEDECKLHSILQRVVVPYRDQVRKIQTKYIIAQSCAEGKELTVALVDIFIKITGTY